MANDDDTPKQAGETESPGLLTGAARAIGSAIGKVSTTLHLAESNPATAVPRKKSSAKKAPQKPAKKKLVKKTAAPAKKSAKKLKS